MEEYIKYQHLEKLGSDDVDGIMIGDVYVFPKIDGTNAQVWFDGEKMRFGSRKRELSIESDNAGFMNDMLLSDDIKNLCHANPMVRFYGEWLVPHSLKTYRDEAWRQLYLFDAVEDGVYWNYEILQQACEDSNVNYIPPLRIIHNPTIDNIMSLLPENTFLVNDGEGSGEGVVLKNYEFVNKYGRITWAKVVTSEFKEKHCKEMGAPMTNGTAMVEEAIVEEFVTAALVEKTVAKIKNDEGTWSSKMIPKLLGIVFHDLVTEHSWDICKKYKMPKVDFKNLNRFCIIKVKELSPLLF